MFKVFYTNKADQDLSRLNNGLRQRILNKIDFFIRQENPLSFAKKLKDFELGDYRFRVGDYRVIFDVDNNGNIKILIILRIKHRKDVYEI